MDKLDLTSEIGEGKDIEVRPVFDGARRKIVQIILRQEAVLKAHQAAEPITVQCIAGAGEFAELDTKQTCRLEPGTLITLDPGVVHEVRALPEVSILLTRFKAE